MYKKITLTRNDYSRNHNKDYNAKIKSISDEIFQTEQIFPAGYIPIGKYNKEMIQFAALQDANKVIDSPINVENFDDTWKSLSDYEKIIASHLLYGFYNTYIFSGSMGSGKTSTATHVLDFIKQRYSSPNSAFIKIPFDFNLGVLNDSEDGGIHLINRFTQELYEKLKVAIVLHIKNHKSDLVLQFTTYIDSVDYQDYQEFFDLSSIVNQLSWIDLTTKRKAEVFIQFVEKETEKIKRIEMLMKFLRFLKIDLKENEFIIIFYDNIDVLEPSVQTKIFQEYILPLNSIGKTKCLICLRRNTFLRSFDYRDTRFAHSYGFIHHHGHTVSDIISQRLYYWMKNLNSSKLFNKIEFSYREALKGRITYIYHEYFKKHSGVSDFLNAISGNCVRLGLYVAHRMLINNIIKYDEPSPQKDRYKKALIVSEEDNCLLSNHDELINLFSLNEKFSLLPLVILKHIKNTNKLESQVKIREILSDKYFTEKWNKDEIINTLKNLLYSRRSLIFTDKPNLNDNLDEEGTIFLTEIGFSYLNYLLEDMVYIQECFMAVMWNSENIPETIDVQSEFERLSVFTRCLRVAFDEDYLHYSSKTNLDGRKPLVLVITLEKILKYIFSINVNNSAYYLSLFDQMEDLITHVLFSCKVSSSALENLLVDIQVITKTKNKTS